MPAKTSLASCVWRSRHERSKQRSWTLDMFCGLPLLLAYGYPHRSRWMRLPCVRLGLHPTATRAAHPGQGKPQHFLLYVRVLDAVQRGSNRLVLRLLPPKLVPKQVPAFNLGVTGILVATLLFCSVSCRGVGIFMDEA